MICHGWICVVLSQNFLKKLRASAKNTHKWGISLLILAKGFLRINSPGITLLDHQSFLLECSSPEFCLSNSWADVDPSFLE